MLREAAAVLGLGYKAYVRTYTASQEVAKRIIWAVGDEDEDF